MCNFPTSESYLVKKSNKSDIIHFDYGSMGYKHKRREQKFLTEDEVERLKAACETFNDQLIVYGLIFMSTDHLQ